MGRLVGWIPGGEVSVPLPTEETVEEVKETVVESEETEEVPTEETGEKKSTKKK